MSIEPSSLGQPLLTPAEAAKHLGICTKQLRGLTRAGSIRYINIGQ